MQGGGYVTAGMMEACRLGWGAIAGDDSALVYVWYGSLMVYAPQYSLNASVTVKR